MPSPSLPPPPPPKKKTDTPTQFLQLDNGSVSQMDIFRSSSSIAAFFFYTDQGSNRTPDVMMVAAGMTQGIYISPVNWIIVTPLFPGFLFTPRH